MRIVDAVIDNACRIYNSFNNLQSSRPVPRGASLDVQEIIQRASSRYTDISDHLLTLFAEAISVHPRLIVELGVRGGESTFAFERAAGLSGAHVLA